MPVTNEILTTYKLVLDPVAALTQFTRLRWYRSITGPNGPFEAISAATAGAAVLTGTHLEPHALNGKTLKFRVNGVTDVEVLFSGADPYTTADAIADIIAETALVVPSDAGDSRLRLTTVATGTGASIEILESEGAIALGLQTGQFAIGVGADIVLGSLQHQYLFTDSNGSRDYWYRTQLLDHVSLAVDALSPPFPGSEVPVIPYDLTIAAFVRIIDMRGRPIEGRRVVVANVFLPNTVGDYNIFRHSESFLTDDTGYAEIRLIRGSVIDVHVEGTTYTRRVTLPDVGDPTDILNLFDPTLESEDEFGIQEPNINYAIRLS